MSISSINVACLAAIAHITFATPFTVTGCFSTRDTPTQNTEETPSDSGAKTKLLAKPEKTPAPTEKTSDLSSPGPISQATESLAHQAAQEDNLPYFFADKCWEGRAATPKDALKACRRLRKTGDFWQRKNCRCKKSDIMTVTEKDPIAYWYLPCCWKRGPDVETVLHKCREDFSAGCSENGICDHCQCKSSAVLPVRGPYKRKWTGPPSEHNFDGDWYQFLAADGQWLDEIGEPPCFAEGTHILTPNGSVPIEQLVPGDNVLSYDVLNS